MKKTITQHSNRIRNTLSLSEERRESAVVLIKSAPKQTKKSSFFANVLCLVVVCREANRARQNQLFLKLLNSTNQLHQNNVIQQQHFFLLHTFTHIHTQILFLLLVRKFGESARQPASLQRRRRKGHLLLDVFLLY